MTKNDDTNDDIELQKARFDYAWKYFDSAARQRMLFFNYFLIIVGILGSAIGFAFKEQLYPLVICAGLFGALAATAFIAFDVRMLAFVNRALRILDWLERQWLFPDGLTASLPDEKKAQQLGLARIEPDARTTGNVSHSNGCKATKVKWWIRSVECVATVGFLIAVIIGIVSWANRTTAQPATQPKTPSTQLTTRRAGYSPSPSCPSFNSVKYSKSTSQSLNTRTRGCQ